MAPDPTCQGERAEGRARLINSVGRSCVPENLGKKKWRNGLASMKGRTRGTMVSVCRLVTRALLKRHLRNKVRKLKDRP